MQVIIKGLVKYLGIPLLMEVIEKFVSLIKREIKIQRAKREIRKKKVDTNPTPDDFGEL